MGCDNISIFTGYRWRMAWTGRQEHRDSSVVLIKDKQQGWHSDQEQGQRVELLIVGREAVENVCHVTRLTCSQDTKMFCFI